MHEFETGEAKVKDFVKDTDTGKKFTLKAS